MEEGAHEGQNASGLRKKVGICPCLAPPPTRFSIIRLLCSAEHSPLYSLFWSVPHFIRFSIVDDPQVHHTSPGPSLYSRLKQSPASLTLHWKA